MFGLKRVVRSATWTAQAKAAASRSTSRSSRRRRRVRHVHDARRRRGDPADTYAPRPIEAAAAAAIGTGRAYVWRGHYLVELKYNNEHESPQDMIKSSEEILPLFAKAIGDKLPGSTDKPASARALPAANLLPNAIAYFPDNVLSLGKVGPGAIGYYKDGAKR